MKAAVTAVLGPTNTGKTHLAVERMCAHSSGIMGFPLRLLAREVYDRVVKLKGADQVALVTGEEKIVPPNARWHLCTVESMPETDVAFVGLDEAQLGTDPERGHVFTDRLLRRRGREETMILGSEALRPMIRALVPDAEIIGRPRFSKLTYAGAKKISRLPKRSAIVAFSAEEVYAVAEMLRRLRGGAAVVMGALSPRTRNAQVAMFQAGEVDYLVATDAIGMGLNMDVAQVAFAGLHKFDGRRTPAADRRRDGADRRPRRAAPARWHVRGRDRGGAGRVPARRGVRDRGASLSADRQPLLAQRRAGLRQHRRADRQPGAAARTGRAARRAAGDRSCRAETAGGRELGARPGAIAGDGRSGCGRRAACPISASWGSIRMRASCRASSPICPKVRGVVPNQWFADEVARLDTISGDVETIAGRIAAIRSWAYIAQRPDWLADPAAGADRAKAIEERLSDGLHASLTQRFVDKRTTALIRQIGADASLLPVTIGPEGEVLVEDHPIGRLDGFRFTVDPAARAADRRLLLAAAEKRLVTERGRRGEALAAAEDAALTLVDGMIVWNGHGVAKLTPGRSLARPQLVLERDLDCLAKPQREAVQARLVRWFDAMLRRHVPALIALADMARDPQATPALRVVAGELEAAGGLAPRIALREAVDGLSPDERKRLRKAGVTIGALDLFDARLLKPGAARWRTALLGVRGPAPVLPREGASVLARGSPGAQVVSGFRPLGAQAVRLDLVERIARAAHDARQGRKPFAPDPALGISMGVEPATFERLMAELGFRSVRGSEAPTWIWQGRRAIRREARPAPPATGAFAALAGWSGHG
jgi:ATP-dependent RNA helicase SUPV3L1/SUV3